MTSDAQRMIDSAAKHIAKDLACALREVSDNFGARECVCRSISAMCHLEGAIQLRKQLFLIQSSDADEHELLSAARTRAFDIIAWAQDTVQNELERVLFAALDEATQTKRELAQLRDQVDRAARSVLATTHSSRRRT